MIGALTAADDELSAPPATICGVDLIHLPEGWELDITDPGGGARGRCLHADMWQRTEAIRQVSAVFELG